MAQVERANMYYRLLALLALVVAANASLSCYSYAVCPNDGHTIIASDLQDKVNEVLKDNGVYSLVGPFVKVARGDYTYQPPAESSDDTACPCASAEAVGVLIEVPEDKHTEAKKISDSVFDKIQELLEELVDSHSIECTKPANLDGPCPSQLSRRLLSLAEEDSEYDSEEEEEGEGMSLSAAARTLSKADDDDDQEWDDGEDDSDDNSDDGYPDAYPVKLKDYGKTDDYYPGVPSYGYYSHSTPKTTHPDMCPPCPTCDKGVEDAKSTACFCGYDAKASTFAVDTDECKAALYSHCDKDERLMCAKLDDYYRVPVVNGHRTAPNSASINLYLQNECPPGPCCGCVHLVDRTIWEKNAGKEAQMQDHCCSQLKIWCLHPFSGLDCSDVSNYCNSGATSNGVLSFVQHNLWHWKCPADPLTHSLYSNMRPNVAGPSSYSSPAVEKEKDADKDAGKKSPPPYRPSSPPAGTSQTGKGDSLDNRSKSTTGSDYDTNPFDASDANASGAKTNVKSSTKKSGSRKFKPDVLAGIIVGSVIGGLLVFSVVGFLLYRSWRAAASTPKSNTQPLVQ